MFNRNPQNSSLGVNTRILALLKSRRSADCFSLTGLAVSTEPGLGALLDLLLRCRTMDEVKELAAVMTLRAENEQGLISLYDKRDRVVARAWLFD